MEPNTTKGSVRIPFLVELSHNKCPGLRVGWLGSLKIYRSLAISWPWVTVAARSTVLEDSSSVTGAAVKSGVASAAPESSGWIHFAYLSAGTRMLRCPNLSTDDPFQEVE